MQADFLYETAQDGAGCQLGVTVLADRAHVRGELRDDAEAAGFRILHSCSLEEYARGAITALGDIVLIDCAEDSAQSLAMLARLDSLGGDPLVKDTKNRRGLVDSVTKWTTAQGMPSYTRSTSCARRSRTLSTSSGPQSSAPKPKAAR